MTLRELFNLLDDPDNARMVLAFFLAIPILAALLGIIARGKGHLAPWKYIFAVMIYLVSIPGIFALTLNVYLFLFEQQSIMNTNLYTQILPVISMVLTIVIIRSFVDLDWIPWFNKLPGLFMIIVSALAIMWFVDRTRIWMVSFLRFEYVLGIFLLLLIVIRYGWNRVTKAG